LRSRKIPAANIVKLDPAIPERTADSGSAGECGAHCLAGPNAGRTALVNRLRPWTDSIAVAKAWRSSTVFRPTMLTGWRWPADGSRLRCLIRCGSRWQILGEPRTGVMSVEMSWASDSAFQQGFKALASGGGVTAGEFHGNSAGSGAWT